jgi:DNA-binding protein H-NS
MTNLEDMSLEDLKKLSRDVEKAIASFEERKRKEALKAVEKVARDHGFSLDEVVGAPKAARKPAARRSSAIPPIPPRHGPAAGASPAGTRTPWPRAHRPRRCSPET